ncbi:hypothetical protein ECG_07923 [Echinococcus granulosus]|nr:hypothetical protein ECG_07923 [Echinococcus granulosus]
MTNANLHAMDLARRRRYNYHYHRYDCWTEDQIRKQLGCLMLFPAERFLRATTSADHLQQTEGSNSHLLTYSFGDILWIPNISASSPTLFGVNLTRIRGGSECPWSITFCDEILKVCMDSLILFSADPQQANKRIATLLKLHRDSRNPVGWLHTANQWAVPVGLFCPQSCNIRRSIVIVGQRGLRKEAVLKCLWTLAPDAFYIPSTVFEVDDFDEEIVTVGANWPLALSGLDDAFGNWRKRQKKHDGQDTTSQHILRTARRAGAQLSTEMLACARRTVKSGRIPIVVIALSVLGEWRASAELAAFVVLLQSASARNCLIETPENVDISLAHTPSNPARSARAVLEAFHNMNTGNGSNTIPWKPEIWYTGGSAERCLL